MAIATITNFANMQVAPRGFALGLAGSVALALATLVKTSFASLTQCLSGAPLDQLALSVGSGSFADCTHALEQFPGDSTIRKIAAALGGNDKFCQLPVLPYQDRFHEGGTGYIDGVRPTDLTAGFMRGVDPYARPYVAIHSEDTVEAQKMAGAETLFQRYTDHLEPWTSGSHYQEAPLVGSTVDSSVLDKLARLKNGETIEMPFRGATKQLIPSEDFLAFAE
jgi:hypothetical protein